MESVLHCFYFWVAHSIVDDTLQWLYKSITSFFCRYLKAIQTRVSSDLHLNINLQRESISFRQQISTSCHFITCISGKLFCLNVAEIHECIVIHSNKQLHLFQCITLRGYSFCWKSIPFTQNTDNKFKMRSLTIHTWWVLSKYHNSRRTIGS